jgi:hypothetical protein
VAARGRIRANARWCATTTRAPPTPPPVKFLRPMNESPCLGRMCGSLVSVNADLVTVCTWMYPPVYLYAYPTPVQLYRRVMLTHPAPGTRRASTIRACVPVPRVPQIATAVRAACVNRMVPAPGVTGRHCRFRPTSLVRATVQMRAPAWDLCARVEPRGFFGYT